MQTGVTLSVTQADLSAPEFVAKLRDIDRWPKASPYPVFYS